MKELDKEEVSKLAKEYAQRMPLLKTHEDLIFLSETLRKHLIERALNTELDYHLETEEEHNTRNGYSRKTIQTEDTAIELVTPRDRNSTFEPALIKKGQRRFTSMDDKILALYARGMTTRDIEQFNFEKIKLLCKDLPANPCREMLVGGLCPPTSISRQGFAGKSLQNSLIFSKLNCSITLISWA